MGRKAEVQPASGSVELYPTLRKKREGARPQVTRRDGPLSVSVRTANLRFPRILRNFPQAYFLLRSYASSAVSFGFGSFPCSSVPSVVKRLLVVALLRSVLCGVLFSCCLPALPAYGQSHLPMEPLHDSGQSVTAAFEGWFKNPDGSFSLLFGYFNRNLKEELDIPIGPNNRIEPGGPDLGQPTHFLPRRHWGAFTITVPKDFGEQKLTWTLVANGQTTSVPGSLNPLWELSPFFEIGLGNTPPIVSFEEAGPSVQGPRTITAQRTAKLVSPLTLSVWVADDAKTYPGAKPPSTPPVVLTWSKFRGPGDVAFANAKPAVEKIEGKAAFNGRATTTVKFSEPGEYILEVVANDWSGEGGRGFQCCWKNALVKVSVQP